MVNAILLVYYEKYYENALQEFLKILDGLGFNYQLLIVSNNKNIKKKDKIIYEGNNANWEFSGWDEGIELTSPYHKNDFFIFCNDTFCHHRSWGFIQRDSFTNAFKNVMSNNYDGIVGEVDTFKTEFSVSGSNATSWVSTYLFGMSARTLEKLDGKLSLKSEFLNRLVPVVHGGEILWDDGGGLSDSLKARIENWMSHKNKYGWYKRNCANSIKLNKIRSIVNEIYISAYLQKNGYRLWSVYSEIALYKKIYLKFQRYYNRIKKSLTKYAEK